MTLIKRSDRKSRLSMRSGRTSLSPSGLKRPDAAPASATRARESRADIGVSPDGQTTSEAAPNQPSGNSVETPAKVGNSGSPS